MQTTVNPKLTSGIVGELYDDSLHTIDSYDSIDSSVDNIIGYACTTTDGKTVTMGGTGTFAGILANPKQYANYNISMGATNVIPDYLQVSVGKVGRYWVDLGGVAAYGASVYFVNATGALGVGTAGAGQTQIANAKVIVPATSNGLAVIEIK